MEKKKKLVKTHMKIFSYQYNQVLGLTAFFRLPIGSKKAEYLLFEKEKYSQSVMPTRGLHRLDFSDQARPGPHGFNLDPAQP